MCCKQLVRVVVFATLVAPVCSGALVYEAFDYGPGSIIGQAGGAGWDSAWSWITSNGTAEVLPDSLVFSDYDTSGGALQMTMAEYEGFTEARIRRELGYDFPVGSDLWISFLYQQPNAPLPSNASRTAEIRHGPSLSFRMRPKNSGSQGVGIGYDSTVAGNGTKNIQDGRTYLFICRFGDIGEASGKMGVMWVIDEPAYNTMNADGVITETELNTYKYLFAQDAHAQKFLDSSDYCDILVADSSNTGFSAVYDELRYGTSLSDVLVPEPTTIMLLGLGACAWIGRGRK